MNVPRETILEALLGVIATATIDSQPAFVTISRKFQMWDAVPGIQQPACYLRQTPGRVDQNEDFGLEQITGNSLDRYKFRTSPLRNVALQAAFFHNGAFTRLEDAIRHHLDVFASARHYNPGAAGVDSDLMAPMGPMEPVLTRVDPILVTPIELTADEFQQLVDFVRNGLLDRRATPEVLKKQIPKSVPSGFPVLKFQAADEP